MIKSLKYININLFQCHKHVFTSGNILLQYCKMYNTNVLIYKIIILTVVQNIPT